MFDPDVKLAHYKYNGGQLYINPKNNIKPLTISVDWFEPNVVGYFLENSDDSKEFIYFDDVILIKDTKRKNGTKHYKYCYQIYLDGELFGLVNTIPRSRVLPQNLSVIKIENHILYQKGWMKRFEYIIEKMQVQVESFSRLDIAVDGGNFLKDFKFILSKQYEKVGSAESIIKRKGNRSIKGFQIGSFNSNKYIKYYNKTDELKSSNKNYISEMWKANGLTSITDVERLELTLKNKAVKQLKNFDYRILEDSKYLASIMRTQFKGFYEFVLNDGTKNVTRKEKIQAVDWSYFDAIEMKKLSKTNKPNKTWAAKLTVKFLMEEAYTTPEKDYQKAYAESYQRCDKYALTEWFESKLPFWEKEWSKTPLKTP